MVTIDFAKAFRRHVDCPAMNVEGGTLRAALEAYFDTYPSVRSYVLDDAGSVRKHVTVFVGADLITDRAHQTDPVADGDRIHVFQALSGG